MWSAIQNDLFEFVSTVKSDTARTLSAALGAPEDRNDEEVQSQRHLKDLRRSFATYNEAVAEHDRNEYNKFRKSFTLASQAVEIGTLLDEEPDVPRYYAELVPATLCPEEFWARGSVPPIDALDEDEDIGWETTDDPESDTALVVSKEEKAGIVKEDGAENSENKPSKGKASIDDEEKEVMRKQIKALVARVSDLERCLAAAEIQLEIYRKTSHQTAAETNPSSAIVSLTQGDPSPNSSPDIPSTEECLSEIREDKAIDGVGSDEVDAAEVTRIGSFEGKNAPSPKNSSDHIALANLDDEEWENSWS